MAEIEAGQVTFDPSAEDIHMNVEVLLTNKIGAVGKKLHTGRSRNDQVAVDVRMYLRHEIENTHHLLLELMKTVVDIAEEHKETILPGYTHLQRRSRSALPIICWPMRKCSNGTSPDWKTAGNG